MMSLHRLGSYVALNKPTDCYSTTGMCKPMILEERGREREGGRVGGEGEGGREEERKGGGEGERRGREERDQGGRKREDGTFC